MRYNAASPDEKALVEGAMVYDHRFIERTPEDVTITTNTGARRTFKVLNVIEFTSSRKRMSIIVKTPEGEIKLMSKGADSVILERLGSKEEQRKHYDVTIQHLEAFAREGLRTLCLAVRVIPEVQYREWEVEWKEASSSVSGREEKVEELATIIKPEPVEHHLDNQEAQGNDDEVERGGEESSLVSLTKSHLPIQRPIPLFLSLIHI